MIQVENLVKAFGPKLAVNDVSFTVERGEVLGFLGPNGAGKSTTMRMVTGFIPPTSGTIRVAGYDVLENPLPAKRRIGYLPENAPGYGDMTVQGFLLFAAELRGLRGAARRSAVDRAVELCFLENVRYQVIDTLSKGYKHRTCLAQSLVHDPDVLVMDEPTDGLDPNQKHEVRNLIKRMGANKAIVFSTHILEEVEAACSRVIIIDRGRIVANGTPEELKARAPNAGAAWLRVKGVPAALLAGGLSGIANAANAEILRDEGGIVEIRVYPDKARPGGSLTGEVAELAAQQKWQLEELQTEEGRLDEVFRAITLPDTVKGH
ncbi:MAG: ATP-binding cassette domain-containing protein [Betaproteobacteria bacterium]|nr:ATP-binding cassette domain-containing protein [Betaproteobacteria bacterium]MDH3435563.1 ATP-binding cassette domain-containing protein [Betaproteobacteria bacterium]